MFKLQQIRPEGSDCTAPYDVILDKEYTVREFVDTVVSIEREWGCVKIHNGPSCEYKWGKLLNTLPDDVLNKKITYVEAHGGWSLMNYKLWIE